MSWGGGYSPGPSGTIPAAPGAPAGTPAGASGVSSDGIPGYGNSNAGDAAVNASQSYVNSPNNPGDPYSPQIAQGFNDAQGAYNDQSSLVQQLIKQMTGAPDAVNLAAQQLHAALQQNAAAAGSAMASVKGINPGVARYNVLNQEAAQNQAAAGQAAQLRSQEQEAAQVQLANVEGQQAGEGLTLFGNAGQLQNAQSAANLGSATLATGAQEFEQQQSMQMLATITNLLGAGAGAAVGKLGTGSSPLTSSSSAATAAPSTTVGNPPLSANPSYGSTAIPSGFSDQSIVAPGDYNLSPNTGGIAAAHGALVPGRARVAGNSSRNDTVPALLSPGEIVIPRTYAQSPELSKEFVGAVLRQKRRTRGGARASA